MGEDFITGSIVFDTKALDIAARGLGGGGGRAGGGGGGPTAAAKNLKGMSMGIGKMAGIAAAGIAVFAGIKSLLGKLVAASPQLQASLGILKKSFEFMLRPIGDAIGSALRPFALSWLRFALKWYKDVGPKMAEWLSAIVDNTSEFAQGFFGEDGLFGGDIGTFLSDLFKDAIPAQFVETWNALKDSLRILWKFLSVDMLPVWKLLGSVLGLAVLGALKILEIAFRSMGAILEFMGPIINTVATAIGEGLAAALQAIPEIVEGARVAWATFKDAFKVFFTVTMPNAWESFKAKVVSIVKGISEKVTEIWTGLTTIVSDVITSIKNTIVSAWETISTKISDIVAGMIEAIRSIPLIGGLLGGGGKGTELQDFMVRGNQVIPFSPQDTIMGFKGDTPPGMGGGMTTNVTININAIDASSIDSSVLDKIVEAIDNAQRRGILSRTMQAVGN